MTPDASLITIAEALTGHTAKPFIVVDAMTGRPLNWFDAEAHACEAARFASIQGQAHVVYRAIALVEPVVKTKALITHAPLPEPEPPAPAAAGTP